MQNARKLKNSCNTKNGINSVLESTWIEDEREIFLRERDNFKKEVKVKLETEKFEIEKKKFAVQESQRLKSGPSFFQKMLFNIIFIIIGVIIKLHLIAS